MTLKTPGWVLAAAALGAAAALAAWSPWLGLLIAGAVACFGGAASSGGPAARVVFVNVAAVLIALAVFEGFLWWRDARADGTRMEGTVTEHFTAPDPDRGYAPSAGSRVSARKYFGDTLIYDVTYTIGQDGLRVTPRSGSEGAEQCVAFFGDSITFGEGVNDDETMPAATAAAAGSRARIYNFAFSGYGPHQMLAAIESGFLATHLACRPTHFVFLTILTHVARSAGLASWDRHGPRYRLDAASVPVRQGNFDSPVLAFDRWPVPGWVGWFLERSRTYQEFFGRGRAVTEADLELYLRIIERSRNLSAARYPGSEFHVLLWADERGDARVATIASRLAGMGIAVHLRSKAVPEIHRRPDAYVLNPQHDQHPNPAGHRLAAEYVATAILGIGKSAAPPAAASPNR